MNSSGFSRIVVSFAVMILALYISLDVFAGGTNVFGKFYLYSMIGGFVVGLFAPKKGFYFLLFLTAYLDYFKRLMILDAGIRQFDLYYVLGIAPATMAGIMVSVLYQLAVGAVERRPREGWLAVATLMLMGGVGAMGLLSSGGGFRALGDIVNSVAYMSLVFVVPALFRTPEDLRAVFKTSILIFIPSVFYYLYQTFAGFTWWEYKYMVSGFTLEVRQLQERVVRVFGTLNSAGAASVIYSLDVAVLLFAGFWKYRDDSGKVKDSSLFQRVLLGLLFGLAAYRTFSRTGWLQGIAAAIGFFAFRSRALTRAFYIGCLSLLGLLVAFSGYMLKNHTLNRWTASLLGSGHSDEAGSAFNLSTLNARFEGFYNITHDAKLWTPFGVGMQGRSVEQVLGNRDIHDAFSLVLLKVGYVPLFFGIFLVVVLARAVHRFVLNQPDGLSATLGATALSCAVANVLAFTVNGSALNIYPLNFYIYFDAGIVVSLMLYHAQLEKDAAQQPVDQREPILRNRSSPYLRNAPAPPAGRFRPPLSAHRQ
jgi:hypothetical protein